MHNTSTVPSRAVHSLQKSYVVKWLGCASQGHQLYYHDLKVVCLSPRSVNACVHFCFVIVHDIIQDGIIVLSHK